MGKCKFGKWIYSKTYKVSAFHCCYGTEQGCYFENCQEECPNFIEVA